MSTLIVSVEDAAMLANIKTAIEQLRGVASVTDGVLYDATDCDAYREAMEDVKAGRVFKASSVEDMFKQTLASCGNRVSSCKILSSCSKREI